MSVLIRLRPVAGATEYMATKNGAMRNTVRCNPQALSWNEEQEQPTHNICDELKAFAYVVMLCVGVSARTRVASAAGKARALKAKTNGGSALDLIVARSCCDEKAISGGHFQRA